MFDFWAIPELQGTYISFSIDVIRAFFGWVCIVYGLRYLDRRNGYKWAETIKILRSNPLAYSIYLSTRLFSTFLYFALCIG